MGALESARAKVEHSEELRYFISQYRPLYAEYAAARAGIIVKGIVTLGIGTLAMALLSSVAGEDENWNRIYRGVIRWEGKIRRHFTIEEFNAYFPGHIMLTNR